MKFLSKQETELWCRQNAIVLGDRGFPDLSGATEKFDIPPDAQQRVALVAQYMAAFRDVSQTLVWFNDWSVWPSGQRMHMFDRFRMSYGEARWLIQTPGHVFERDEFEDTVSFVTFAALFLWDCYVVIPKHTKLLFLCHDEFGLLQDRTSLDRLN
jgi:hypothetical protein